MALAAAAEHGQVASHPRPDEDPGSGPSENLGEGTAQPGGEAAGILGGEHGRRLWWAAQLDERLR